MRVESPFLAVESLVSEGRFLDGLRLLQRDERELRDADALRVAALKAELLEHAADRAGACAVAEAMLPRAVDSPAVQSRLLHVMGAVGFDNGDYTESFSLIQRSITAAEASGQAGLVAKARLGLLTRFVDSENETLNASALLPEVRRSIARAGDPHLLVGLRLTFARMEASRRSVDEARRHLCAAADLLSRYPNLWLGGRLELAYSVLAHLSDDPDDAADRCRRAIELARQSGHFRTHLAALVNLSHALHARGDFAEAYKCVEFVLSQGFSDVELRLAALDTLANVKISEGLLQPARETLLEIARLLDIGSVPLRSRWVELNALQTRVRLLQAEREWQAAEQLLVDTAEAGKAEPEHALSVGFRTARLRGLLALGRLDQAADLLSAKDSRPPSAHSICERTEVDALAKALAGNLAEGIRLLSRARRLVLAIGHAGLAADLASLEHLMPKGAVSGGSSDREVGFPDLDTAVALLELGGYTHVLGPEALAVVHGAECAKAAALIATGPKGVRVIDTRGWDHPAALAALKKPDGLELIPLGEHRDETWQLVVDPKPDLHERCTLIAIRKLIDTALSLDRYRRDEKQRTALWPADTPDAEAGTIWASEQTTELVTIARRIAPTPLSVLLTGETGTGKEMLARTIHRASDRADRPFLPFNCTAVPREMLDSQLFGYRKGAFTGADASFAGVIRSAAGGTLFLDEIAEIGLDLQPKLLRFLETREIHPLGEPQPITVDVRVIAATNANLERAVAAGRFREDLFYRLNVVQLKLPPLRERREEIPPLVQHYLERFGQEQKKTRLTLGDDTFEYLLLYSWPGNVRQLANEVRRMVAMAESGAALTPAMLSPEIQASRRTIPAASVAEPELRIALDQPLPAAVKALEQSMIRHALRRAQGRVEEAARMLGISRKGLFLKRRRWGLAQPGATHAPTPPAPASPAGYDE